MPNSERRRSQGFRPLGGGGINQYNLMQNDRLRPTGYNPYSPVRSVQEMAGLAEEAGYEIDQNGEPVQAGSSRYGGYGSNLKQNNAARNEMRAQRRERRMGGGMAQPAGNAFFSGMEEVGAGPDPATANATNMGGLIMGAFNPMMSGLAAAPLVPQGPTGSGALPAPQRNSLAQRIREAREMAETDRAQRMDVAGQAVAQQRSNQEQIEGSPLRYSDALSDPAKGNHVFNTPYGTVGMNKVPPGTRSAFESGGAGRDDFFRGEALRQGMPNKFADPDQDQPGVRERVLRTNPSAARASPRFLSRR